MLFHSIRFVLWMAGLILCMCEAAEMKQQCINLVIGLLLITVASLPDLISSGYELLNPDELDDEREDMEVWNDREDRD